MACSWPEWEDLHLVLLHILKTNTISFHAIPEELMELQDRVGFFLALWDELQPGEMDERHYAHTKGPTLHWRAEVLSFSRDWV